MEITVLKNEEPQKIRPDFQNRFCLANTLNSFFILIIFYAKWSLDIYITTR